MRDIANKAGLYEREVRFYELIGSNDLPIPRYYYGAVDTDSGASILILEDLGHFRLADIVAGASSGEAEGAEYQRAFFWPFMVVLAAVSQGAKHVVSDPAMLKVTLERLTAFIEDHKVDDCVNVPN